jgi:segregation and condensation protein B
MNIKPPFLKLSKNEQKAALEVLLFAEDEPMKLKDLFNLLIINSTEYYGSEGDNDNENGDSVQISIAEVIADKFDLKPDYFIELINEINNDLMNTNRPYQIINVAGGYQFATLPEYGELLYRLTKTKVKRKFTQASLETLSIIAYKQPVTKPEIEEIRGVNSNEIVNNLLEKKLIKIDGRRDVIGKPLLYSTTSFFLKTFGLKSLDDLPRLRDLEDIASDEPSVDSHIEVTLDVSDQTEADELQEKINKDYKFVPEDDFDETDFSDEKEIYYEDEIAGEEVIITKEEADKDLPE